MAKRTIILGALLGACGLALLGFALTQRKPALLSVSPALEAFRRDLELAERELAARVNTMATSQPVKQVVGTDSTTAQEMLERELAIIRPQKGERIELGQLANGAPQPLLTLPAGTTFKAFQGKAGEYLELEGGNLTLTKVVELTAISGTQGYLAASNMVATAGLGDRLRELGRGVVLHVNKQALPLGPPLRANQPTAPLPFGDDPRITVEVDVVKAAGSMAPMMIGGGVLLGVSLIFFVLGLTTRPARPAAPPAPAVASAPTLAQGSVLSGAPAATPESSNGGLGAGSVVGKWEIISRLGTGGMAEVYKARAIGEAGFAKLVALKVMHPHLARMDMAVQHFLDEARLAAQVVHPNVVQIFDLGKLGNDYAIAMEYVEGIDLEQLLRQARLSGRPVPVAVALGILRRVCDGLHAAHSALAADGTALHIVHRDVKAANVLVSRQGGVKVVDFGIAKATQQSHLTRVGETKGTPSMMAPEQRVGDVVDVRVDVYATAAVGYELFTGLEINLDLAALAHLGVEGWPHLQPPSQVRPELPRELDPILLGALAFERERRPADCDVLERALEAVANAYNLNASDKDIARWMEGELAQRRASAPMVSVAPTGLA